MNYQEYKGDIQINREYEVLRAYNERWQRRTLSRTLATVVFLASILYLITR